MTPEEKRRLNRLKVAMGTTGPSVRFGMVGRHPSSDGWVGPWPCKKDHHPDNVVARPNGNGPKLLCVICDNERRARNRKANRQREKASSRRYYYEGRKAHKPTAAGVSRYLAEEAAKNTVEPDLIGEYRRRRKKRKEDARTTRA